MSWTTRAADYLGLGLVLSGLAAAAAGVHALGERRDLLVFFWVATAGLLLVSGRRIVDPGGST